MKKYILLPLLALVLFSCKDENVVEDKVAEVKVGTIKVSRFDELFYNSKPEDLPALKRQFPYLFPREYQDTTWINKINTPLLQELHAEVDKVYPPNDKKLAGDIEELVKHIKYYYPKASVPHVVTLISEMDYESRAIYADTLVLVSLDLYLGNKHKYYVDFPAYQRQNFEPNQILPDLVSAFSHSKIAASKDYTLLSSMIYFGKQLYLKDKLIPEVADNDKIGYTKEQLQWVKKNESDMWMFFVENKAFYDTDPKLLNRFINPAPFSKFYLGFDNETPGRVGQWVGWQIVRAYMENNKNVTLQELLALDAKTIFDNSKYKPVK